MGETTGISWADSTFNIAIGCEKCSEGCAYCYAERDMENPKYGSRFKGAWGPEKYRYTLSDAYWKKPLTWQRKAAREGRRIRVFTSSLCDVFEQHGLIDRERARLFDLVAETPNLDWLLLTKRIERAEQIWPWKTQDEAPRNLWIGTTVENQARANQRVPPLLRIPAWRHFVSSEPLLGSVDYTQIEYRDEDGNRCLWDALRGYHEVLDSNSMDIITSRALGDEIPVIDWIIAGGETGKHARPMHPEWPRFLRDQAERAGIPFHFKQWGEWLPISEMSEAETNALYESNKKAPQGDEWRQPEIDEAFGRRCTVPTDSIQCNGLRGSWGLSMDKPAYSVFRVGKKRAGRLLGGQLYDAVPEAA